MCNEMAAKLAAYAWSSANEIRPLPHLSEADVTVFKTADCDGNLIRIEYSKLVEAEKSRLKVRLHEEVEAN